MAGTKMLQPAPAFSSTVSKGASAAGGGSSRNSRTLLPTSGDHSSSSTQQPPAEGQRPKLVPLVLTGTEMPPSYQDCIRTSSTKRPSLRAVCATNSQGYGGQKMTRQNSGSQESESGMRKRSVSFPENVQALAEQFVTLGLSKDSRNLLSRDANGNVTVSSSLASSALHTPKGKSPDCSRRCTPDRGRQSLPSNVKERPAYQCSNEWQQNGRVGKWEEFETRNGNVPVSGNDGKRS